MIVLMRSGITTVNVKNMMKTLWWNILKTETSVIC